MAINFPTAFTQLGRILHLGYLLTPYESSLPGAFNEVYTTFASSLEIVGATIETQADTATRQASQMMNFAQSAAQGLIQLTVQNDPAAASQAGNLTSAMTEFIRQMNVQGVTVQGNRITATPTPLPGFQGGGTVVVSVRRGDGLVQENAIPETLRLSCTADAYTGTAQVGREAFGLTGEANTSTTVWDYDYPTGSGAQTSVTAVSASAYANTTANLLTNGDFANWTGSPPALSNWALGSLSAWGADVSQNPYYPQAGLYALGFNPGTGVTSLVYQQFGAGTGTAATPNGLFSYAVNFWMRQAAGTVTAGTLVVELTDGTGTTLNDAQGNPNTFSIDLTTVTGAYMPYNGVFRMNATPPATIYLRFRLSVPLTGATVVIDNVCYAPLTAMYAGGPGFVVFSNPAAPFVFADAWNLAVTNDYGGALYLGTFQTGFARLFNMPAMNLLLPSVVAPAVPTISNTLISSS